MTSSEYWAEREAEALKHYIKDEAAYDKELQRIYKNMLDGVQGQIDAFYGKYANGEGITLSEAKKRVSQLDIAAYERKAKKYVKEKNFTKQANEEMRLYNATMRINRLEMLKANIGLELIAGHDEMEKFMEGILQGRTEDELKRQAGILGETVLNNAAKAKAIVNSSFHNATFSDRIWMYQDILRDDLDRVLQTGLIQGKNPRVLAREVRDKFNTTTYNAERLMRTELARVQTEAQKQSFERNGFDMYEFICNFHASKHGTCDICKGLNGKHFKVQDMMPGENAPPMHPHCRCSTAAWVDDDDYEAWLDYLSKGGTTEEWNKIKNSKNRVENFLKNGNITSDGSVLTRRKTTDEGREVVNQAIYHKVMNPVVKKGGKIITADDEWKRYLDKQGATAVTIGETIILRPDATTTEVLEEAYHFEQNRKGINNQYPIIQRKIMNEIEAQEYLISVADKYKIPEAERIETKSLLESYKKQREALKQAGEWDD